MRKLGLHSCRDMTENRARGSKATSELRLLQTNRHSGGTLKMLFFSMGAAILLSFCLGQLLERYTELEDITIGVFVISAFMVTFGLLLQAPSPF